MTKAQLLEDAPALPADERIDLAMSLWDSLEPTDEAEIATSPALRAELRRRIAADEANPRPAENWDELRAKVLRGQF